MSLVDFNVDWMLTHDLACRGVGCLFSSPRRHRQADDGVRLRRVSNGKRQNSGTLNNSTLVDQKNVKRPVHVFIPRPALEPEG